jgi:hypothetical protein
MCMSLGREKPIRARVSSETAAQTRLQSTLICAINRRAHGRPMRRTVVPINLVTGLPDFTYASPMQRFGSVFHGGLLVELECIQISSISSRSSEN